MNPFLGQIMMFCGNFAPRSWAYCDGQLLAISQNTALFSILGTTYGGDGRTTFGLPDMRGRVVVSPGNGPGLSPYGRGQKGGVESNILTASNLPEHSHSVSVPTSTEAGGENSGPLGSGPIYAEEANATYQGVTVSNTGSQQSVNNMGPYVVVNYIIALQGTFPSRS